MKYLIAACCVATLCAAVSATAFADADLTPADKRILQSYTLTLPKVKAFEASSIALKAAEAKDPSLKADAEAAGAEHTADMNGEFAKMDHHPRTFAFFAKNGLSKQDVILIPMTLMAACMVVQYPSVGKALADQTSTAQVGFCKTNQSALSAMPFMKGK